MAATEIANFAVTIPVTASIYLAKLPLYSLRVDPRYQRVTNERKIRKMIAEYDSGAVGALDVSERPNNTYAVFDGQHRLKMLQVVAPDSSVNCVVHAGLSAAQEARLFHRVNANRDRPSPGDRFRARLFYGDEQALEVQRVVNEAGLSIDLTSNANNGSSPHTVNAVNALEDVYSYGGSPLLLRTLTILHTIWPDDRGALTGEMLHGMGMVLKTYGDSVNTARLIDKLQALPLQKLMMESAGYRALLGGASFTNIARAIVRHYNHALRNRLDESELGHPQATKARAEITPDANQ
jgi:hypothetical protein